LVTGGCCVQPFFSSDGAYVLYLDKPAPDARTGLWAVTLTQPLQTSMFFSERLGPFSNDMSFNAFLQNGRTIVERTGDGQQWTIDNGGRRVIFSPDNTHIVWAVGEESGNFDVRKSDVYIANTDGSDARTLATLYGGGVQSWFHDSARLLVNGKANRDDVTSTLSILNVSDGSLHKLVDVERARAILISPDDGSIVYYVSQARDETQDGLYSLDVTQPGAQPVKLDFFGAYRWCSPTRLYYVPMQPGAPSQSLWRFDVTTLQSTPVISAGADSPFHISNGDWDLSPDGRHLVYVNASDHNIWLISLTGAC
jgi:Tol biopolymer transport system component